MVHEAVQCYDIKIKQKKMMAYVLLFLFFSLPAQESSQFLIMQGRGGGKEYFMIRLPKSWLTLHNLRIPLK